MVNESGEQTFRGNGEQERLKLSFPELYGAMADFLYGTVIMRMLAQVNLEAGPDGNVAHHVIDNLRSMLNVASAMTNDENARINFDNMRAFLAPY